MTVKQEMFRFVATRRSERALMHRINSRLIRDRRQTAADSVLARLYGPGPFETKLVQANGVAASALFVDGDDPLMLALEPAIDFFRERLVPGIALADLTADFRTALPLLATLLTNAPPEALLQATRANLARLWDSLYAQTLRGCDRYVSTNHLVDGLRVYHVLALLWLSDKLGLQSWVGGGFDDYHTLIDLQRAMAAGDNDPVGLDPQQTLPAGYRGLKAQSNKLVAIDAARFALSRVQTAGMLRADPKRPSHRLLDEQAQALLRQESALSGLDLVNTPVQELARALDKQAATVGVERERTLAQLIDKQAVAFQQVVGHALVQQAPPRPIPKASLAQLVSSNPSFRVPLDVGPMKPALVGDLVIVEQNLLRYELGELADSQSIMRGERRERSTRRLSRTSQSTTTEKLQEEEQSSSTSVDERFSLTSQAQQTASENFGIQASLGVSAKYGPVQVNASVNASYDTSKSSSDSQSQEYAKTVTEEASKRVKSSIKQSSSITILNETQENVLQGFNNQGGSTHVNGLYRWINRVEQAQLVNYGRRMMLSLDVHQPAAFYRALLSQDEAAQTEDLVEPIAPWRLSKVGVEPLPDTDIVGGIRSFEDIREHNYALLAAQYDVSVEPPPPEYLTGSKALAYPEAMEPSKLDEHEHKNDLSLVTADNTLTLDPSYRLASIAVFASTGASGDFGSFVDALKLGEDGNKVEDANLLLVQVAGKSFYLSARKDPNDGSQKLIKTNFNQYQTIDQDWQAFGEVVQPALPITFTANFEGAVALTVVFQAYRLQEAFDRWRARTFAAIVKGYNAKKQAYDQSLAVAEAKASGATAAQTFQLRSDQYRSIEAMELKRGCIELMSRGTATGYTSMAFDEDGNPRTVFDEAEGATLDRWRAPLANGAVASAFEGMFEWENMLYQFHPYYWAGAAYWKDLARASGADPLFEQFLRCGNASVVVPVRPGYERVAILFFKSGLLFSGGYLSLFNTPEMLDVYADVELGRQFDPPLSIGDPWEVVVPTSLVMLQDDSTLPNFEAEVEPAPPEEGEATEPSLDETVPF